MRGPEDLEGEAPALKPGVGVVGGGPLSRTSAAAAKNHKASPEPMAHVLRLRRSGMAGDEFSRRGWHGS